MRYIHGGDSDPWGRHGEKTLPKMYPAAWQWARPEERAEDLEMPLGSIEYVEAPALRGFLVYLVSKVIRIGLYI